MATEYVQVTFRAAPALAKRLRAQADHERRTINNVITYALERYLEEAAPAPTTTARRKKEAA